MEKLIDGKTFWWCMFCDQDYDSIAAFATHENRTHGGNVMRQIEIEFPQLMPQNDIAADDLPILPSMPSAHPSCESSASQEHSTPRIYQNSDLSPQPSALSHDELPEIAAVTEGDTPQYTRRNPSATEGNGAIFEYIFFSSF